MLTEVMEEKQHNHKHELVEEEEEEEEEEAMVVEEEETIIQTTTQTKKQSKYYCFIETDAIEKKHVVQTMLYRLCSTDYVVHSFLCFSAGFTGPKLKCEFCGKVDYASKFRRSKRFCSVTCAKRFNVACAKRLTGTVRSNQEVSYSQSIALLEQWMMILARSIPSAKLIDFVRCSGSAWETTTSDKSLLFIRYKGSWTTVIFVPVILLTLKFIHRNNNNNNNNLFLYSAYSSSL